MSPRPLARTRSVFALILVAIMCAPAAPAALAAPAVVGGVMQVTSVIPSRFSVGASPAVAITVDFDKRVQASTLDAQSFAVWGRWSGVVDGTRTLENGETRVVFKPDRPFFPGEQVTVSLSSALTSLQNDPLAGGHAFSFRVRTATAPAVFTWAGDLDTRSPGEGLAQTYGAYAGDFDGDGAPDLALPTEVGDDVRMVMNDGCGNFSSPPVQWNLGQDTSPSANEGADFNGDGLIDIAVANNVGDSIAVLLGDGTGGFSTVTLYPSGAQPRGLCVLDAEGDGDVDIVTAHRGSSDLGLFLNQGDGTFGAMMAFEGGGGGETSVAAADANGDGWTDLFVAHFTSSQLTVLLNDGAGGFAVSATRPIANGPWSIALGDVDNDGAVDAVSCGSTAGRVSVLLGDGAGGLAPHFQLDVGNFPIAADLGDLDGDTDLDLVCSNFATDDWTVYLNQGNAVFGGRFELPAILAGSCAVLVDYDRNGMLDILGIDELADVVRIWKQEPVSLPLVAEATCTATLRLNNFAVRTGYGGRPPLIVRGGDVMFLGVTAPPGALFGIGVGSQVNPGTQTLGGPLHLGAPIVVPFLGFADANGEASFQVPVPTSVTPGVTVTLQLVVEQPFALVMGNSEVIQTAP